MVINPMITASRVPAHTGGADLSDQHKKLVGGCCRPRPHGRGGFKFFIIDLNPDYIGPRPHGRGGFKSVDDWLVCHEPLSPPTRAGRI